MSSTGGSNIPTIPITSLVGRELDMYPRIARNPTLPSILGITPAYPAIQYLLADILGMQPLTAGANLQVGGWYFLDTSAGVAFSCTLPALNMVNPGDAVGIACSNSAGQFPPVVNSASGDIIRAGAQTGSALICNVPDDWFFMVAGAQWNAQR